MVKIQENERFCFIINLFRFYNSSDGLQMEFGFFFPLNVGDTFLVTLHFNLLYLKKLT